MIDRILVQAERKPWRRPFAFSTLLAWEEKEVVRCTKPDRPKSSASNVGKPKAIVEGKGGVEGQGRAAKTWKEEVGGVGCHIFHHLALRQDLQNGPHILGLQWMLAGE